LVCTVSYADKIEKSYAYASHTLLDVLLGEKQLMARLRSIKSYLFLEHGDFFIQFFDSARDELNKPLKDVWAIESGKERLFGRIVSGYGGQREREKEAGERVSETGRAERERERERERESKIHTNKHTNTQTHKYKHTHIPVVLQTHFSSGQLGCCVLLDPYACFYLLRFPSPS
jgi:hypothetical protein